ncbi:MAG: hypothetical protein A3J74_08355 [Elusimicrobia bacterium RIFCSPHIGHO2_02_FULL_57_9]|nr:MAG: hypothetical protein A3J74_08355 [Elusimicrobia bacterium RIFCSPHIGHO2_02_FULL_57_9]
MDKFNRPLILSVEDDPDMLLLLERILTVGGYEVKPAAGCGEALEWLKSGRPDLILTDVMMPQMSGYEFCAKLQAAPELALIPVVFLTALDTAQDKARALAAGAGGYLTKPINKKEMLEAVSRHARTKGQWNGLKEGLSAAAWPPRSDDMPGFLDFLRDKLKIPPETMSRLKDAAVSDIYQLGALLDLSAAQAAEHAAAYANRAYLPRINPESIQLGALPTAFCRSNRVIAIRDGSGELGFALSNPFNRELVGLLGRCFSESQPKIYVTAPANISMLLKQPGKERGKTLSKDDIENLSIPEIAENILETAVFERASDIHIEPKNDRTVIRFRVDGDMREVYAVKPQTGLMLITRFKALGELDVAERRKPQDGSMQTTIDSRAFIVRLATTCTPAGESLILRLLEPWAKPKPLEDLGMSQKQVRHMVDFSQRNHGLVIIAGPTGSGKTTTIYSLLQHIDCEARSLISVEDPVEYRIAKANQQQVDEKAGLTFEALLKSSLRQDPDILFLGEMRDPFSAKMAIDFASTGHLTVSSIHTTNATTAVFRLERLGITRGAMADSILGVIAQKLVKRLCPHCKQTGPVTEEEAALFSPFTRDIPAQVARPAGCPKCAGTGFLGREGIYEIVKFYPEISDMIRRDKPISEIRDFARQRGDMLITDHAIEKVRGLVFSPRLVYETVLLEESEYREKGAAGPAPGAGDVQQRASGTGRAERFLTAGAPPPPAVISSDAGESSRILVVEDDPDTRALIARILGNQGFAVTLAEDGVAALKQMQASRFDLILSDINMPNLDGLKMMEIKMQKKIDSPVIFFTSSGESEALGLELGAEDYIKKPVAKEVLLARVKNVLKRRSGRRG